MAEGLNHPALPPGAGGRAIVGLRPARGLGHSSEQEGHPVCREGRRGCRPLLLLWPGHTPPATSLHLPCPWPRHVAVSLVTLPQPYWEFPQECLAHGPVSDAGWGRMGRVDGGLTSGCRVALSSRSPQGRPRLDWTPQPSSGACVVPGQEADSGKHVGLALAGRCPESEDPSHTISITAPPWWCPAGEAGFPRQGPHAPFLNKRHSSASNKNAAEWMRPVPLHTVPGGRAGQPRSEQPAQMPGPRCDRSHPNLLGQRKARVLPHHQPSPNPCLVSSTSDHGRAAGSPPSPAPGSVLPVLLGSAIREPHSADSQRQPHGLSVEPSCLSGTTKAQQTELGRECGWVRWCWHEPSPFPPSAPSSLPAPRGGRRASPTHGCPSLRASGRLSQPWHGDMLLPGDLSHWAQGDVLVSVVGWPQDRRDRGGPAQRSLPRDLETRLWGDPFSRPLSLSSRRSLWGPVQEEPVLGLAPAPHRRLRSTQRPARVGRQGENTDLGANPCPTAPWAPVSERAQCPMHGGCQLPAASLAAQCPVWSSLAPCQGVSGSSLGATRGPGQALPVLCP